LYCTVQYCTGTKDQTTPEIMAISASVAVAVEAALSN